MSIPTKEQASRFLAPLKGSLAILLLHETQAKAKLSRFMLRCASLQSIDTTILDSDAFYCTNMERFAEDAQSISEGRGARSCLNGASRWARWCRCSLRRGRSLIIDDLNSLYSLASDGRKSHQLTILMKLLSHNARMNGSWAIATAYRAELDRKQSAMNQRSLTALGDLLIDTDRRAGSIRLKVELQGPLAERRVQPVKSARRRSSTWRRTRTSRCRWRPAISISPRIRKKPTNLGFTVCLPLRYER